MINCGGRITRFDSYISLTGTSKWVRLVCFVTPTINYSDDICEPYTGTE